MCRQLVAREQYFQSLFLFSDQPGPAGFPRDSFLCKEINCNTGLQEVKVIALTFQFAYEEVQSTDASELSVQQWEVSTS